MRLPDWEQRLLAWAEGMPGQPFEWGRTDCHALAIDAFQVMHGFVPEAVPRWATERQALALLAAGWEPQKALPRLGAEAVRGLGFCQRGDVVVEAPKESRLHGVLVALGHGIFLTSHPGDLVGFTDRTQVDLAATVWRWPVG